MNSMLSSAMRNVLRQIHRSRSALLALCFGVVAMILAAGFIDWNLDFGRDNTIHSQLGHIQIVKPGFIELGRSDPNAYLLDDSGLTSGMLESLPGFRTAAPRLLISGLASFGDQTLSFIGEGVAPAAEALLSAGLRFPAGRNLAADEPATAILGEGLARNLGAKVGDLLVLISNTPTGGISAVEATVVGVFNSISSAYDDVALRIPIELARELSGVQGEHMRIVLLDDVSRVDTALAELRASLPGDRYMLVPWYELADFYNKTAALFKKQVGIIYVIIALVIVLSISNTMTMAVVQRIGEIGTIMALGIRRKQVMMMFLAEGLLLGVIGTLLGVVVGVAGAGALTAIGIPMPPGPGMSWGFVAGVQINASNIVEASCVAIVTAVLASIYPAWHASRLNVVDALRSLS